RGPLRPAADFQLQLQQRYGQQASTLLPFYPASNDAEAANSQYRLARDLSFGLPAYAWATAQSQLLHQPAYVYRFARKVPATGEYVQYGAFHTGEVPYVFGTLRAVNRPWEPGDYDLMHTMMAYWSNFVRTGNPNGPDLPAWPAYQSASPQVMLLDLHPSARPLPDQSELDFLRALPGN
ncbi:MAG: carboxylesterase family protein, partial [Hymenobacter sp.]